MKKTLLSLSVGLALMVGNVQAGFLEDFYSGSGAGQANVTSAGIYQSQGLNTVTGGGYVFKAPRKDFTPFHFSPPSLSAGCGGIDIFLGAFSIPSKEEFVAFLRSIGSALPGLAFQLALQTLSPDLSEQVTSFRDLIREYTAKFSDSCTAAQTLLEMSGAQEFMYKVKHSATNALRSQGLVSDAFEADARTRTDGGSAYTYAQSRTDTGGNTVDAPEMNLTWTLLGGGEFSGTYPKEMKELMMTLVGTTIYTRVGDGADTVTQSRYIEGADITSALFGNAEQVDLTHNTRLRCLNNDPLCLDPQQTTLDEVNLTNMFWNAAEHYRQSIITRNPDVVTEDEIMLLATATTIPLLRIINATATERFLGFSQDILRVYVEAAAYEAIVRALEQLTFDINRAITASSAATASKINEKHAKDIQERLRTVRADLAGRADKIYQQMNRTHSFIQQVEHLERSVLGNAAREIALDLEVKAR